MSDIAIIIPHYNDLARLTRCLDALMPQLDSEELVVVDNSSTEDLAPLRTRWPDLRLIVEPKKGAACARNRGVAETRALWLLFLDSDCVPASDWLAAARALTAAPRADIMGGMVTVFDETPPPRSGAEAYETVFAFHNKFYIEARGFSVTANLLTRRDVFQTTGQFRNGLSEDIDWCNRARAEGFRIAFAAQMRVRHPTRSDWPSLARKAQRLTTELYHLEGGSPRAQLGWALRALAMPLSALPGTWAVLRHPDLQGSAERARCMGTLFRLRFMRMIWMLRVIGRAVPGT